jgi:monoamine oxidase
VTRVGPQLQQPLADRVWLAGEHTCYAFVGYMEGALQSGARAAVRIARVSAAASGQPPASSCQRPAASSIRKKVLFKSWPLEAGSWKLLFICAL